MLTHKIENDGPRVSSSTEGTKLRITIVGGTAQENLGAARLAMALAAANGFTKGGLVRFGSKRENMRWAVSEFGMARRERQIVLF